jgi:copper ion binding protein
MRADSMEKVTFPVRGMTCEGCQAAVEKAIGGLVGVDSTIVNLQEGSATVDFDQSVIGVQQMKNAVEEAGFDVD